MTAPSIRANGSVNLTNARTMHCRNRKVLKIKCDDFPEIVTIPISVIDPASSRAVMRWLTRKISERPTITILKWWYDMKKAEFDKLDERIDKDEPIRLDEKPVREGFDEPRVRVKSSNIGRTLAPSSINVPRVLLTKAKP